MSKRKRVLLTGAGGFIGDLGLREPTADELLVAQSSRVLAVGYLHVHPLRRGRGWGECLVRSAVRWADQAGVELVLYVASFGSRESSEASLRRLYEAHGFVAAPRQRGESLFMRRPCRAPDSKVRSRQR